MKNPNCYKCKYRSEIPGDAHSCCTHPKASDEAIFFLADLFNRNPSTNRARPLNVRGNAHGVKNGWFCWPTNFDPIWLENCNGFEEKGENKQ